MKEEIFKRIDLLAEKLGVASGHVWEVLVTQAKIDSYLNLFYALFFSVVAFVGVKHSIKKFNEAKNASYSEEDFYFICGASLIVLSIFATIAALANIDNAVTGIFNPEYRALKAISNLLKGKM